MAEQQHPGDHISAHVSGPVQGQVAVGRDIAQSQSVGSMGLAVGEAELADLRQAFADVRTQVAEQAPPARREAALERVDELEEAVIAEEPDLTTVDYVKRWFAKNLPELAGSVVGLIVHPVVGKLAQAAGEAAVDQLDRILGRG